MLSICNQGRILNHYLCLPTDSQYVKWIVLFTTPPQPAACMLVHEYTIQGFIQDFRQEGANVTIAIVKLRGLGVLPQENFEIYDT